MSRLWLNAPSVIATGDGEGTEPPLVKPTTGVKFVPESVRRVVLGVPGAASSPTNAPLPFRSTLMAAMTSSRTSVAVLGTPPALSSGIGMLPVDEAELLSNSNTFVPPRTAMLRRSPSIGRAVKSTIFCRSTGCGTTETTCAPRSSRRATDCEAWEKTFVPPPAVRPFVILIWYESSGSTSANRMIT